MNWNEAEHGGVSCGLGKFRLPGATVVSRVTLDILPIGASCWVPGRFDELLFAAVDGQLYRCCVGPSTTADEGGLHGDEEDAGAAPVTRAEPLRWRCEMPGTLTPVVTGPVTSPDARLRRLVFVALRTQTSTGRKRAYGAPGIWWLKLDEHSSAIVAAGRLTEPERDDRTPHGVADQFPHVTIGPSGTINLFYLSRLHGETGWRLRHAPLEIDELEGAPRIAPSAGQPRELGRGLAGGPLAAAADGQSVFACSDGETLRKYSIGETAR